MYAFEYSRTLSSVSSIQDIRYKTTVFFRAYLCMVKLYIIGRGFIEMMIYNSSTLCSSKVAGCSYRQTTQHTFFLQLCWCFALHNKNWFFRKMIIISQMTLTMLVLWELWHLVWCRQSSVTTPAYSVEFFSCWQAGLSVIVKSS